MELANRSKLGRGEKDVRVAEHKKAAKHIRIGIKQKQKKRDAKGLEEVGTFWPVLLQICPVSDDYTIHSRQRTLATTIPR